MIDGDAEWERLFADPRSPLLLDKLMEEAMAEIEMSFTATSDDWQRAQRNYAEVYANGDDTTWGNNWVRPQTTTFDTTWTERDERLRDIRGRGVDDMPEPESTQPWQEHMIEQVDALIAWRHEQRAEIATLKRQCKQLRNELVGLREKMAEYEADS